jgi:hypothetical protein
MPTAYYSIENGVIFYDAYHHQYHNNHFNPENHSSDNTRLPATKYLQKYSGVSKKDLSLQCFTMEF